jgi:hypothetical protein
MILSATFRGSKLAIFPAQGKVTRADLPVNGWLGRTPRGQT